KYLFRYRKCALYSFRVLSRMPSASLAFTKISTASSRVKSNLWLLGSTLMTVGLLVPMYLRFGNNKNTPFCLTCRSVCVQNILSEDQVCMLDMEFEQNPQNICFNNFGVPGR